MESRLLEQSTLGHSTKESHTDWSDHRVTPFGAIMVHGGALKSQYRREVENGKDQILLNVEQLEERQAPD